MARTGDRITKRKSDGLYMARYTVHTADGPKRKTIYGKRYGEVREKLTKAMADRDGGLVFDAGKLTVGEYLKRWLADSVKDTVRQRTYEGYAHIVERHIAPSLGRVKLKNLAPAHVRALYRERLDSGLSLAAHRPVRIHDAKQGALTGRPGWSHTPQRRVLGTSATTAPERNPAPGRRTGPCFSYSRLRRPFGGSLRPGDKRGTPAR